VHEPLLAPTKEMLMTKKRKGSWEEYEHRFRRADGGSAYKEKLEPSALAVPTACFAANRPRIIVTEDWSSNTSDKWSE